MTLEELSNEFDILYNNISSNLAPGLEDYEKSVFLTTAQEQLVISAYQSRGTGEAFELNEASTETLERLVKEIKYTGNTDNKYSIPEDLVFIIQEEAKINTGKDKCDSHFITVRPVSHDEINIIKGNPFRKSNKKRVLRLTMDGNLELISEYPIIEYKVRYLRRPRPIIIEVLDNTTINGETKKSEPELPAILHRAIVNRAVKLAQIAWMTNNK